MIASKRIIADAVMGFLEAEMEKGWGEFIKGVVERNRLSNERVFKILTLKKGKDFTRDLQRLMKACVRENAYIFFDKKPKGTLLKDNRWKVIREIMVDQRSGPEGYKTVVSVQIDNKRWISFNA